MAIESKLIWMDGELVPFEKATVHFLNTTLHYGVGVFEGIRCYATPEGPAVFRLREHMQRMINSVKVLGLMNFHILWINFARRPVMWWLPMNCRNVISGPW